MEDKRMGNKDGFDPSISQGVQSYRTHGEWVKVIHPGGYLESIDSGSVVLFETKRVDGERRYWFGRVTNNAYWFLIDQPVNIFAVDAWFRNHKEMIAPHDSNIDMFVDQCELPF